MDRLPDEDFLVGLQVHYASASRQGARAMSPKRAAVALIAVCEIDDEVVRLRQDPADVHLPLGEVRLGVADDFGWRAVASRQ